MKTGAGDYVLALLLAPLYPLLCLVTWVLNRKVG